VLPRLLEARRATRRLRIWSAAASTGQEPYTLAMILDQMQDQLAGWKVEILATDYSRPALQRARAGIYNHFEVQRGLPIQLLSRYFDKSGEDWQVAPRIRDAVTFQEANLLEPFAHLGRFDVVFCRNVLIYFDVPTKADVLDRIAEITADDGYLLLGASETAIGITGRFERVQEAATSIYRPTAGILARQARAAVA
jgi:chemotaxis protein methyltransferase CheR